MILQGFQLLLLTAALPTSGQHAARKLLQAEAYGVTDVRRNFADIVLRPFEPIRNPEAASSSDAQRLYDQASSVSAIAYMLFAAAGPLSTAEGSSAALLPYLTPTILRIYASQPGLCSSSLVAQLYGLTQRLYGSALQQACHYDLYKALRSTFGWVAAGNIPLAFQSVPGQPASATAAWPDLSALSDADFAVAVIQAVKTRPELSEAAAVLSSGRCGLDVAAFAALVPSISSALSQLHADLAELQAITAAWSAGVAARKARWLHGASSGISTTTTAMRLRLRRAADQELGSSELGAHPEEEGPQPTGRDSQRPGHADAAVDGAGAGADQDWDEAVARRALQQALSPDYVYSMPPAGFVMRPPSKMPKLMIGLVFHVMQYRDGDGVGPPGVPQAPAYATRMVRIANYMTAPTNITFFVKEVRSDPVANPYLLLKNRKTWLSLMDPNCVTKNCISKLDLVPMSVVDFPRSINIFVASDVSFARVLGYSHQPGSEFFPQQGVIVMTWDQLSADGGANSLLGYNDGVNTLTHEVFHHLGLEHPFWAATPDTKCPRYDNDYVSDTPIVNGAVSYSDIIGKVADYCMEVFWGQYGGDWEATYARWNSTLGIPDLDKNAWADSCPDSPGFDELGNFMTYNTPVCFAALGHFTPGQAQRAHYRTSEYNPVMYAWGQYYAAQAAPPPPQLSPPPEPVNNTCRITAKDGCPCKSVWFLNKQQYSYCDRTGGVNRLTCEVADRSTCAECDSVPRRHQCILMCNDTPQMCKKPPAPGVRLPPPPPPLPPAMPPMPPPPPPRTAPGLCKVSAGNCACRATWMYNITKGSYCSQYRSSQPLWCVVTPDCPDFMSSPLQRCSPALTDDFCAGPASQPLLPPSPDPPPLAPPPRAPKKPRRPK